jgi:TonB-linked SusC/RagA family outer membrane protein
MSARFRLLILCMIAICGWHADLQAQQVTVRGTVVNAETGEPVPSAIVAVEGTNTRATTDAEGKFVLQAPSVNATLVVSVIGYTTGEVPLNGRTDVVVRLSREVVALDELVVVGYGTQRKKDVTGAVASVQTKDFEAVQTPNVEQLLRGKVAGVQVTSNNGRPGQGATIRIRGANSITASNEPLYVVDGFVGGNINAVNPDDIESIQILKDASSTAIYGARGANGVILVTTKRGQGGAPQVNLRMSRGWQSAASTLDLMSGPERAAWGNLYNANLGQGPLTDDPSSVPNVDWQDFVLREGVPVTELNLSAQGGGDQVRYYFSAGLFDQQGIIESSSYRRLQAQLNLDADLSSKLRLGTTLNVGRIDQDEEGAASYYSAITFYPFLPIFEEDGSYAAINPYSGRPVDNPAAEMTILEGSQDTRLLGGLTLDYVPMDGLTLRSRLGGDLRADRNHRYRPSTLPTLALANLGGDGRMRTANELTVLNENTVQYDREVGDHRFDLLAGATYQHAARDSLRGEAAGFVTDAFNYYNLAAGDPTRYSVDTDYIAWTILSFLGRANYSYNDKYLLTATMRRDGSSRLGANNKWSLFPSAAVGWRLSEEPFMQRFGVFDDLKLRASYGVTGNQAVGVYSTLPTLTVPDRRLPVIGGQQVPAVVQGNLPNPDLKWETTRQFDLGLEASVLDGRISFSTDYYTKQTSDLLLEVEVPQQTGYSAYLTNIGAVRNEGVELQVRSANIVTSDFVWSSTFNISTNRNRVLDLGGKESLVTYRYNHNGSRWVASELRVGQPIGLFVGAIYEGVWQSQEEIDRVGTMPNAKPGFPRYADVDGNGEFQPEADFTILGDANPDFFGGFQNTFAYKGLSLTSFLQFSYGNEVMNLASADLLLGGWQSNHLRRLARDAWTPDNPNGTLPTPGAYELYRNLTSTLFVEDGSFLRLQYVTLEYDLPVDRVGLLGGMSNVRAYVTAENPWILTGYSGLDPEVSRFGSDSVLRGFDRALYPRARTITVGLNLGF